jgi:hypothetical protein
MKNAIHVFGLCLILAVAAMAQSPTPPPRTTPPAGNTAAAATGEPEQRAKLRSSFLRHFVREFRR